MKARLVLIRDEFTTSYTTGKLYLNNRFVGYTVEDMVRTGDVGLVKIAGLTAIPAGTYPVQVTYSPKFNRLLPLVIGVRNFSGIRIHNGVSAQSSEGCIIVSRKKPQDGRLQKDNLYLELTQKLRAYDSIELTIREGAFIRLTALGLALILAGGYYLYKKGYLQKVFNAVF
jgi:hypothetical protein